MLWLPAHALLLYSCDRQRGLHSFPTRRSSDLLAAVVSALALCDRHRARVRRGHRRQDRQPREVAVPLAVAKRDRKSTRLNSSHANISYAGFCLQKKRAEKPEQLDHLYLTRRSP